MIAKLLKALLTKIHPDAVRDGNETEEVERWQRIAAAENELDAQIWLDILKSHNVPAYLQGTDALSSVWSATMSPASFSLQLWAKTRDALSVREILGIAEDDESHP